MHSANVVRAQVEQDLAMVNLSVQLARETVVFRGLRGYNDIEIG